jgi:hypothetical protein
LPTCPKCGAETSTTAKFCENCGAAIPSTVPSPSAPLESAPSRPKISHVGAVVAIVLVLIIVLGAFYGLSHQSVRGLGIQQINGMMSYRTGLLGSAEFDVRVRISSTGTFDITISQVTFGLTIDNLVPLSAVQATGSTFSPGQTLMYVLRFTTTNPSDLQYISRGGSHQITVSITAWSSSGIYAGWVTASASNNWNWGSPS